MSALKQYFFFAKLAGIASSTFDSTKYSNLPPTPNAHSWYGATVLRRQLQEVGRLNEAGLILEAEDGFAPSQQVAVQAHESFLAACTSSARRQPIWYLKGTRGMLLAKYYAVMGRKEQAVTQLRYAEGLLRNPQQSDLLGNLRCELRYNELQATPFENLQDKYKEWMTYADYAASNGIYSREASALDTALAALIHCRRGKQEKHDDVYKVWTRLETLCRRLGNVERLSRFRQATFNQYLMSTDDYGTILQWVEDFERDYPDFEFFEERLMMLRNLITIASVTHDELRMAENMRRVNQLMAKRDTFWRNVAGRLEGDRFRCYQDLRASLPVENDQPQDYVESLKSDAVGNGDNSGHWLEDWMKEELFWHPLNGRYYYIDVGSTSGMSEIVKGPFRTLLHWLRGSLQSAQLSEHDIKLILRLHPAETTSEQLHRQLSVLDSSTILERLFGSNEAPISIEDWEQTYRILSLWLLTTGDRLEDERHALLATVQRQRAASVPDDRVEDRIIEYARTLNLLGNLNSEVQLLYKGCRCNWRNIIGLCKDMLCFQSYEVMRSPESDKRFIEARDLYKESIEECVEDGNTSQEAATHVLLGQLYVRMLYSGRTIPVGEALTHLEAAEALYIKMRQGYKQLGGMKAVESWIRSTEAHSSRELYRLLVTLPCKGFKSDEQNNIKWLAVQKAKAQGLAMLARAQTDWHNPNARILPFAQQHIDLITKIVSQDIVFIDWYCDFSVGGEDSIIMVTARSGEVPQYFLLAVKQSAVEKQARDILSTISKPPRRLRKNHAQILESLQPLVDPISKVSKRGETLVLSPASVMNGLPLHAFEVDGELLIRRNPIAYTSSMAFLFNAVVARYDSEEQSSKKPWGASVFGDPPTPEGESGLSQVASTLDTVARTGEDNTQSLFRATIKDIQLFHYHGHATFDEENPLEHCLEFRDNPLTVRDIFDLSPVPNCYHATLLACGSGMARVTKSNEVLGLVPALMFSGAASTVSSLWSIDDKDAALFSPAFYKRFGKARRDGGGKVDLAKALQEAVLSIFDGGKTELYHWAPFVLNGYWMYHVGQSESLPEAV